MEKKEKALKLCEAMNRETGNLLALNELSGKDVYLEADGYNTVVYIEAEVKEAVIRAVRAYTQTRVMALTKELQNLMEE